MQALYRYTELTAEELEARLETAPVAVAAWGALEWHGPHLPLGLDGLVAEAFAERLAARTGAVLLPPTYLPITALPHRASLSFRSEHVAAVWRELFQRLGEVGFRVVCLVSGHYAQGHELELMAAAETVMEAGGPATLVGTPLSLLEEPELLDHAGRYETGQLLALRPDLVHLERLPEGETTPAETAVLGQDPRRASAEEGRRLLGQGLEAWAGWVARLVAGEGRDALAALYARRRDWYADYVRRYHRESWEQAILDWWAERTGQAPTSR